MMSKKKIWAIIILMSIALLGVIVVQIYWIESSIQVRHEQFERSVNEAMNCVVSKLETQEAFSIIDQQSSFNNPDSQDPLTRFHNMLPNIFDSLVFKNIDINDSGLNYDGKNFSKDNYDTVFHFHDSTFYRGAHNHAKKMIRSINDSVQYYMKRSMNLVSSKMNKLSEVMQKMALEFLQKDENITRRIDPQTLDNLIASELKIHKVNSTNYNYGIINTKENKLLVAKHETDKNKLMQSEYKAQLF